MYIKSGELLGQPPKPKPKAYRVFSQVEVVLRDMRQNPKKWEGALLETMLHPIPTRMVTPLWRRLFDWCVMEGKDPEQVAKVIRKIGRRHLWSQEFARRYRKEKKFIEDIERRIDKLKPQALEPYLLETALLPASEFESPGKPWILQVSILYKLAQSFVREQLPKGIISKSSLAAEVHYYRVGKILYDRSQERQRDDPAFKARVEKALKGRKQKQGGKRP